MTNTLKLKVIQSMKSFFYLQNEEALWQTDLSTRNLILQTFVDPQPSPALSMNSRWALCKPTIGFELGMATILCIHTLPKNMHCDTGVNVTDWRKYQSVRY